MGFLHFANSRVLGPDLIMLYLILHCCIVVLNGLSLHGYLFFLENRFSSSPLGREQAIQLLSEKGLIEFGTSNHSVHVGEELLLQLVNEVVEEMVPLNVLGL